MLKKLSIIGASVFLLAASDGQKGTEKSTSHKTDTSLTMDYFGQQDQNYKYIRDDLYKSGVHYYFLTSRVHSDFEDEPTFSPLYLKRFGYYDSDYPERADPYLTDKIDGETWRQVYDTIYSDQNNVYCRHDLSSGARLFHLQSFQTDKARFVYVRNGVVPNQFLKFVTPDSVLPDANWFLTNGDSYIDYRCRVVKEDEMKARLKEQIVLNPPDYSDAVGMPIPR